MSIDVTPDIERMIAARVSSGHYQSTEEVLRVSLRLLEEHERSDEAERPAIREKIAVGVAQARRGELYDGPEVFRDLMTELEEDNP